MALLDRFLTGIEEEQEKKLLGYLKAGKGERGDVLLEQGDQERDLYFLIEGTFEVYQKISLAGRMCALKVNSLEAPLIIGEGNLFLQSTRKATILISGDVKYFILTAEKFEELKKDEPEIAIQVLENAGKVVTKRFLKLQDTFQQRIIAEAGSSQAAMAYLKKYVGEAHVCSPQLAKKLFGSDTNFISQGELDEEEFV